MFQSSHWSDATPWEKIWNRCFHYVDAICGLYKAVKYRGISSESNSTSQSVGS
ncbi:hypothetical protein BIFGAL_02829 [Bifidobacterium gallicum DSM 20093 = LMG 11596]|uniref:Uncharacterized protein n=1 Tax=Bifidobacterium gallicum DSM 20093 = LMG 11596 TaxID=561180 RepID=D1NSR9_9BIFI|nr:hypothetical protein BIFGAL_02829 [Bifidobacterium gallicum DSM 20093 = LMG 11596]